jgi:integrase/recombinase XerC
VKAVKEATLAPKWLDKKQRAALLRAMDKSVEDAIRRYPRLRLMYLRDAAIVKLLLYAGLRVGEIIQLRMSDVSLVDRKGSVIVREGKGTKRREIPLNAKARKAILDYLRIRPDVENDFLLLGQRNEAIKSKTVQRSVNRFAYPLGLIDVTPHTLRHTFAKSLIDNGVSLEKVATLLGHSNLNTTRIYTTPGMQDLEDAINGLDKF